MLKPFANLQAVFSLLILILALPTAAQIKKDTDLPWKLHGRLTVSKEDPHFFAFEDGTPFFWLGDTGWEMIHLLTRQEISYYYSARKRQGFNVIQTVILSEFKGLTTPNAYGALPLTSRNPADLALNPVKHKKHTLTYTYWDHVDFAVAEAERQGMFIALLPCWGEYVIPRERNAIFFTREQAYNYGNFLGRRYRHKKNVIWILGGDRRPDEIDGGKELWRQMAKGIADGTNGNNNPACTTDYTTTLMTYHSSESSSKWFQQDEWLDFNMWGSYHDNYGNTKAFEQVYKDNSLPVTKPTLNGEPAYEEHPVNWLPHNGAFEAYDVRQIAYWSVFAGAPGHTYGCNPVWQFFDVKRPASYYAHTPWKKALNDPGASQLNYLKKLVESRPMLHRQPANQLIVAGEETGNDHCIGTMGKGFAFFYLPTGKSVTLRMDQIAKKDVKAWWFNPRTGEAIVIGLFPSGVPQTFTPPGISKELDWLKTGRGCDWVLALDDTATPSPPPGTSWFGG